MADMSAAINSILSDPEAMEQIKALGGMLGLDGNKSVPQQRPAEEKVNDISSLISSIGGKPNKAENPMPDAEMLGMMMKFAPLLSSMNEDNDSTRLLYALKPFLSEKRRMRVDQSVRLLGIMRILPIIKESGFLGF